MSGSPGGHSPARQGTPSLPQVVEVLPQPTEVAVIHLPPGVVARVFHPAGPRDYQAAFPDDPLIAAVPGDAGVLGWGAWARYLGTRSIRNGHHQLDRPVWRQAERAVRQGGVVYVQYEQRDHYGRARWTAVGLREGQA